MVERAPDRCGVAMRHDKVCGRPSGHPGVHQSVEAFARKGIDSARRIRQDPALHAARTRKAKLAKFGMAPKDYAALLESQEGRCWICRRKPSASRRLAVDHNHRTGEVRGLLCIWCNREIGMLHENVLWLTRAAEYLTEPPSRQVFDTPRRHVDAPPIELLSSVMEKD